MTGLFAGNMFDMGAPETIEMYERGEMQFASILERIPKRPWFIDDADALIERLEAGAYRRALIFVDNSGTDIVLGVMPLVREFARRGMPVVMAANSTAALNDITIDELNGLLEVLSTKDPVLSELVAKGSITTVPSGTGLPLIDLSEVGDDCNRVARDCDLVVLEGMGRGVESNWRQTFNCDVWRVALIKDACVAKWLGCKLFVPVCRFE
jgi:type II pantothenate kinase